MSSTCYLYRMKCGPYIKIGISNDPRLRRYQLQDTGTPDQIVLESYCRCDSRDMAMALEADYHRDLHKSRSRGEWFRDDRFVREACGRLPMNIGEASNRQIRHALVKMYEMNSEDVTNGADGYCIPVLNYTLDLARLNSETGEGCPVYYIGGVTGYAQAFHHDDLAEEHQMPCRSGILVIIDVIRRLSVLYRFDTVARELLDSPAGGDS